MKTIAILALAPLILAACGNAVEDRATAPGPISPAVVVSEHQFNVPSEVTNDCTREHFISQGNFLVLLTATDDGAGGFHTSLHIVHTHFTFTNTATGETFLWNQTGNVTLHLTRGALVNIGEITFKLAGPGGRTEVLQIRFKFIVNANGTLTVFDEDFRLSCR